MNNQELKTLNQLHTFATTQIFENILPFWKKYTIDTKFGGFFGQINNDLSVEEKAEKGLVLNARILWTFSAVYAKYHDPKDLELAKRAYQYIIENFYDKEFGGYYWSVTYDGKPGITKKQIYAQAFVIYGFIEYYKITGIQEVLDKAREIFVLMEENSFDLRDNGYIEACNHDWSPTEDLKLSEKDMNEKKSMNTHLHILEAYTSLYSVRKDPLLKGKLENIIRIFSNIIVDQNDNHLILFFNEKWETKSSLISYGHDIEASWLMHEAALVSGNRELIDIITKQSIKIAEGTIEGLTSKGGLIYENDREHKHHEYEYEWWVQAEAVVGYLNSFVINRDPEYLGLALKVTQFIEQYVADNKDGEWFFRVDPEGNPVTSHEKAGFWKCPYHNTRACLEIMHRIDLLNK
jgi:cellobiose epimerase